MAEANALEDLQKIADKLGMKLSPATGGGESIGGGWGKRRPTADVGFLGVSVPIKVETGKGSLRCYISLPPEVLSSEDSFMEAIGRLIEMGLPVDIYEGRSNYGGGGGGGGGGWGGGQRREFNGGGGGYGNGGGYGGRRFGRW